MARAAKANIVLALAVGVVLAAAIVALAIGAAGGGDAAAGDGPVAVVHDGDGNVHELPLSDDATVTVTTSLGTNVVVVEDGAVRVAEADCENHDCIRQGAISEPGRQVICLPHELWIEVVAPGGESGQMDVGAVAGADGSGASGDVDVIAR